MFSSFFASINNIFLLKVVATPSPPQKMLVKSDNTDIFGFVHIDVHILFFSV